MGSYTSPDTLYKPAAHEDAWGDLLNTSLDNIQTALTARLKKSDVSTALSGTPGQSGVEGISSSNQLALVDGTFASPATTADGVALPPQINIQRYVKPNTSDTASSATVGSFFASTRYGTGAAGDGDAHDYYNVFSIASSSATADLGAAGGHGVIGGGFYGKALSASTTARVWGSISLAQIDTTTAKGIAIECDAVNNSGTNAPDISSGQADGMTVGVLFGAFGAKKNSSAGLVSAVTANASFLQGLTFYANAIDSAGYMLNAPNLASHVLLAQHHAVFNTWAVFGGVARTFAGITTPVLEVTAATATDPLVLIGGNAAAAYTARFKNSTADWELFVVTNANQLLTGTAGGDGGVKVIASGKGFHLGGTTSVLAVGQGNDLGFFQHARATQQSVGAAATDAATTQTLANNLRTALIAYGLVTT